jgi:hypothetical protein
MCIAQVIQAAFFAADKTPPKWVDRLGVEMHNKRRLRENWAKTVLLR